MKAWGYATHNPFAEIVLPDPAPVEVPFLEQKQMRSLNPERARMQLHKHVKEIRMYSTVEDGKKFYVAEGEWFMPENENATGAWIDGGASMLRMVAGGGFEPPTFGL